MLFEDQNEDGAISEEEVLQRELYYPFGLPLDNYCPMPDPSPAQPFLYNGKEYVAEGGLNVYFCGARWYDPAIGRFTGVDPIAADFAHVSGFNYAENMPVSHIDLWGLQAELPDGSRGPYSAEYEEAQWNHVFYGGDLPTFEYSESRVTPAHKTVGQLSNIATATGLVLHSSLRLHPFTSELLKYKNSIVIGGPDLVSGYPSMYMTELDAVTNIQGYKIRGGVDKTAEYASKARLVRIARFAGNSLTYAGIAVEGEDIYSSWGDMNSSERVLKGTSYSIRTGLGIASTRHPVGAVAYFSYIFGEAFLKNGVEYTARQNRGEIPFDDVVCLAEGTRILTNARTYVKIECLMVGDTIMTYNPNEKDLEPFEVSRVVSPVHTNIVEVDLANGMLIMLTSDHPIFVVNEGWNSVEPSRTLTNYGINTTQLEVGDECLVYSNKQDFVRVKVRSIKNICGSVQTYNLYGSKFGNYIAEGMIVSDESVNSNSLNLIR